MKMPKIPHTEGLDEVIDDILDDFESHFTILTGADAEQGHWKAKAQIKALLAETKKPPKELSCASRSSTKVDTSIIPNIDEALEGIIHELVLNVIDVVKEIGGIGSANDTEIKLKSLIESTVQSVIGEDELPLHQPFSEAIASEGDKIIRNNLRAEQRSKLGRLLEGEK